MMPSSLLPSHGQEGEKISHKMSKLPMYAARIKASLTQSVPSECETIPPAVNVDVQVLQSGLSAQSFHRGCMKK